MDKIRAKCPDKELTAMKCPICKGKVVENKCQGCEHLVVRLPGGEVRTWKDKK